MKESIRYEKKLQKENKIKLMCETLNDKSDKSVKDVTERERKGDRYRKKEVIKKIRKKEKGDNVISNNWGEDEARKWKVSERLRKLVEKVNLQDENTLKRKLESVFNVDKERKRRLERKRRAWKKFREITERIGRSTSEVYSAALALIPERKLNIDVSPLNEPIEVSLPKETSHKLSLNSEETLRETLVHSENVKSTLVLNPENCHYSPYVPTNTKDCFVNSPVNTDENTFTGNTDRLKHTNKPTKTLPFPKVFTNSLTRNNVHPDPWPSVDVNTAPETEKNSTDVLNVKLPGDSKSFVVVRKHSESEEASETSSVIVSDSHEMIVNTARDEVSEKGKLGEKINSEQQTNQQTKTVIGRTTKSTNETTITKQQEIFEQQKNILTDEQKTLEEPDYEKLGAKPKNPKKVFKKVYLEAKNGPEC